MMMVKMVTIVIYVFRMTFDDGSFLTVVVSHFQNIYDDGYHFNRRRILFLTTVY